MASQKKGKKSTRGVYEKTPGSGVWYVRYYDQFGRRHRQAIGVYEDAVAEYHKRKREVVQERYDPESVKRKREVLLSQAIDEYLKDVRPTYNADGTIKAGSRDWDHKQRHGKMWKEAFRDYTLAEVTPQMVDRWRTKRLREVSPATVNRAITFLKRVFNVCLRNGTVEKNPCAYIEKLQENNARIRFLSEEEQDRLMAVLPEWAALIVLVAIGTGMRISEQINLLWKHVDFGNEIITIPRSKHGERRHVPMSPDVLAIMRELPSRMRSPWVFPRPDGEGPMLRNGTLRTAFTKALAEAKIQDFHWHDLRHTFASRLAMEGVGLLEIKELMGHKTLAMVQRYAHLSPNHLRQAVAKIRVRGTARTEAAGAAREERRSQA